MSIHLTYATFAPHLGDTFLLHLAPTESLKLTLIEVNDFTARMVPPAVVDAHARGESFSVIFRGPRTPIAQQGTYEFAHDAISPFALFIVPIGPDSEGIRYEAVFNRIVLAPTP